MSPRLLVVDDEQSMLDLLSLLFADSEYAVVTAQSASAARRALERDRFDVVLCDLKMPDGSGMDILQEIRQAGRRTAVIMLTAHGTTDTAIEAMKLGAYDYITKPFETDELQVLVEKAIEKVTLEDENVQLKRELAGRYAFTNIIGKSPEMEAIFELVGRVAATNSSVLISGESGTGKELIASAIHFHSPRSERRFQTVNCGALPENLLESELFGHERGAFTGAVRRKHGLFHEADGGTLFLDEIGEMTPAMQVKLLRVLQDRKIRRVGGTDEETVDVRIIAATNQDLEALVERGAFREDLYYRIHVIPIQLPPLRERRQDIPLLADHFLSRCAETMNLPRRRLSRNALATLEAYDWPGNVRELENLIERTMALSSGDVIGVEDLPAALSGRADARDSSVSLPTGGVDLQAFLDDQRRALMEQALKRTDGVQTRAAELLDMSTRSFRYYAQKLGIATSETEPEEEPEQEDAATA